MQKFTIPLVNNSLNLNEFLEKLKEKDEDSYNYVLQYLE